jgi:hypothetical protein
MSRSALRVSKHTRRRKEADGLRCYVHIGTGNYHVKTARLYTDLGLLTSNPLITRDVVNLFHYLTGRANAPDCTTILVAPTIMRPRYLELIKREIEHKLAGRPARIVAKMNQLEDPALIEALVKPLAPAYRLTLSSEASAACAPAFPVKRRTSVSVSSLAASSSTRESLILPMVRKITLKMTFSSDLQIGWFAISLSELRWRRRS